MVAKAQPILKQFETISEASSKREKSEPSQDDEQAEEVAPLVHPEEIDM